MISLPVSVFEKCLGTAGRGRRGEVPRLRSNRRSALSRQCCLILFYPPNPAAFYRQRPSGEVTLGRHGFAVYCGKEPVPTTRGCPDGSTCMAGELKTAHIGCDNGIRNYQGKQVRGIPASLLRGIRERLAGLDTQHQQIGRKKHSHGVILP